MPLWRPPASSVATAMAGRSSAPVQCSTRCGRPTQARARPRSRRPRPRSGSALPRPRHTPRRWPARAGRRAATRRWAPRRCRPRTTSAGSCTPVGQLHAGDPVAARKAGNPDPAQQPGAVLGVQPRHCGAELLAKRAGQRCRRGLDHRHVQPQFRCGGSDFGADEAGADHHQPRARAQFVAQRHRVIDGAQHVHTGQALRAGP